MSILHAFVLGIVEGITEFLPISSTGHLILATKLLAIPSTEFVKSFEIAIQLGAILSVVVLYWRELFVKWEAMKRIAVAFVPTAVIGYALYKIIKTYFLDSAPLVLWSLALGGLSLILFERMRKGATGGSMQEIEQMSYRQAATIGLVQSVSVVPGVSRAAATIVGGMLVGLTRESAVQFSFLLAVPTMVAATGLDLLKSANAFSSADFSVLGVGFVVSFVVAIFAIKFLLRYVRTHDFTGFGWYRVAIALLFWLIVL